MANAKIASCFRHALVVEDISIIALQIEMSLLDLGIETVTLVSDVAGALQCLAAGGVDVALVDLVLNDENSRPIVKDLSDRGIPYAVMTGFDETGLFPDQTRGAAVLNKPFLPQDLEKMLETLCAA